MKILTIIAAIFLMFSCTNEKPLKKPFVIIYKYPHGGTCNFGTCSYRYIDANGREEHFCESELKYDIGDTIH